MSTFDGYITGLAHPHSVDYFRKNPERPAPLACFLSHVHSDHLQGLESLRAPFIYCSPATRELLLRIEKYPHRMNFQKGILESRRLHYKHLARILRPIPLNTPTKIELTPKKHVRVTLIDANHCVGAVMFLVEGDGKAILYTGDIRAEQWWVTSLVRHPVLIPYTLGTKKLDRLYLDTTFAGASNPLREFPSKAEGLAELLQKVESYSKETIFYFRAWTFGYEDVWVALAAALDTKVHVDRYQMGLYRSLMNSQGGREIPEAASLCGFQLGNQLVAGCLSGDESSRVHSCEPGVACSASRGSNTVYITPIVNRTRAGEEIPEVGLGGGAGDLYQVHELELQNETVLAELEKLCSQHIHDQDLLSQARAALMDAFRSRKSLSLDQYGVREDISLEKLVSKLSHGPSTTDKISNPSNLPRTIRFPYSRHSSYSELCGLVAAFRPKDIHPCTVDPSSWNEELSMQHLFGHLCSEDTFTHDDHMRETLRAAQGEDHSSKRVRLDEDQSTQSTESRELAIGSLASIEANPEEPPASPGSLARAKAKRDEIRRAHRFLHDHAEPGLLTIEPLPVSWTPDREIEEQGPLDSNQAFSTHHATQEQASKFSGGGALNAPHGQPAPSNRHVDVSLAHIDLTGDSLLDGGNESHVASREPGTGSRRARRQVGRERVMNRLRRQISDYLAADEDMQTSGNMSPYLQDEEARKRPDG
ncbi:hypothetical protein N7468_000968 [Penicillium chermesinum]|uniref:Protein artemis n=1 Tax=Penicillium chermesinum TaxID=63820 RepID=A0A9W9PFV7_9EURO|nr:uncharacterized protein N7468_000968 [Penicillium chermesinum]KAJ5245985.1 hypothetical protein N7468_000968 [Penicillium chermesinum]